MAAQQTALNNLLMGMDEGTLLKLAEALERPRHTSLPQGSGGWLVVGEPSAQNPIEYFGEFDPEMAHGLADYAKKKMQGPRSNPSDYEQAGLAGVRDEETLQRLQSLLGGMVGSGAGIVDNDLRVRDTESGTVYSAGSPASIAQNPQTTQQLRSILSEQARTADDRVMQTVEQLRQTLFDPSGEIRAAQIKAEADMQASMIPQEEWTHLTNELGEPVLDENGNPRWTRKVTGPSGSVQQVVKSPAEIAAEENEAVRISRIKQVTGGNPKYQVVEQRMYAAPQRLNVEVTADGKERPTSWAKKVESAGLDADWLTTQATAQAMNFIGTHRADIESLANEKFMEFSAMGKLSGNKRKEGLKDLVRAVRREIAMKARGQMGQLGESYEKQYQWLTAAGNESSLPDTERLSAEAFNTLSTDFLLEMIRANTAGYDWPMLTAEDFKTPDPKQPNTIVPRREAMRAPIFSEQGINYYGNGRWGEYQPY